MCWTTIHDSLSHYNLFLTNVTLSITNPLSCLATPATHFALFRLTDRMTAIYSSRAALCAGEYGKILNVFTRLELYSFFFLTNSHYDNCDISAVNQTVCSTLWHFTVFSWTLTVFIRVSRSCIYSVLRAIDAYATYAFSICLLLGMMPQGDLHCLKGLWWVSWK